MNVRTAGAIKITLPLGSVNESYFAGFLGGDHSGGNALAGVHHHSEISGEFREDPNSGRVDRPRINIMVNTRTGVSLVAKKVNYFNGIAGNVSIPIVVL